MAETVKTVRVMTRRQHLFHQIKKNRQLYLMIAPFMLCFFMFTVLPVGIAVYLSFMDYNVLQPAKLVWFSNYTNLLLEDAIFLKAIKNTFLLALIIGPFGYAFAIAVLLFFIMLGLNVVIQKWIRKVGT